jgi:hypothetical protein
MYTLYNNIVSDIFFYSGICVDFLGTHMISLVLFFRKPGVTFDQLPYVVMLICTVRCLGAYL